LRGRKSRHIGVTEHGYVPSGSFRAGDNNPRVGAQQVGVEQPDSQLVMADQRGLSRLDARRSEHARLATDHPGIEQYIIAVVTYRKQASRMAPFGAVRYDREPLSNPYQTHDLCPLDLCPIRL
jgi:hypothetical protein